LNLSLHGLDSSNVPGVKPKKTDSSSSMHFVREKETKATQTERALIELAKAWVSPRRHRVPSLLLGLICMGIVRRRSLTCLGSRQARVPELGAQPKPRRSTKPRLQRKKGPQRKLSLQRQAPKLAQRRRLWKVQRC
jgi:hypothetical protein